MPVKNDVPVRESDILAACLVLLNMRGVFHIRNNTGATKIQQRYIRFGAPGSPDIFACVNGRFLGIEVKRPGTGRLSDAQRAFGEALERAGGVYIVVYSVKELSDILDACSESWSDAS